MNPHLEEDKKIVSEIYTSSESMDNLKTLCDVYGSRFPGTPGDLGSVKWMVEKLRSYGVENAHYESYTIPGWKRGRATLKVTNPIEKELDVISLPHSLGDEIDAKLVYIDNGHVDVYDKRSEEIDGNIVMVTSRKIPFGMKRRVHRSEKFLRSVLAGARGWIYVNHYPAYGPPTGGVSPIIPAVGVSFEDGSFLARLLERYGEVTVKIETTDENPDMKTYNVICDIQGASDDAEYVLGGSHYDGHDISQGAWDPASGVVTVLEMARVLNMVKDRLKRRIRLVCFGAEEIGLLGSRNYVRMHEDEMDDLRFMLNLDSAGGKGRKCVILHGHPELEPFVEQAAKEMKAELPHYQVFSMSSDHWPFVIKGVPAASSLGDPEDAQMRGGRGYGHTKYDTVDKVELKFLRLAAANYARFILRVANADEWPTKRKTREEIEDFVRREGFDQTANLRDKVKESLRTRKITHPDTIDWLQREID